MAKETNIDIPWSNKNLWEWFTEDIRGVNILDGLIGGSCCNRIDGNLHVSVGDSDGYNRDIDKVWRGISGNIAFLMHEARHTDNFEPGHSSCCGIEFGCDTKYDESNPGGYGVSYWITKAWLTGEIKFGANVDHSQEILDDFKRWLLASLNLVDDLDIVKIFQIYWKLKI